MVLPNDSEYVFKIRNKKIIARPKKHQKIIARPKKTPKSYRPS